MASPVWQVEFDRAAARDLRSSALTQKRVSCATCANASLAAKIRAASASH